VQNLTFAATHTVIPEEEELETERKVFHTNKIVFVNIKKGLKKVKATEL
jgi:hypothetical protein